MTLTTKQRATIEVAILAKGEEMTNEIIEMLDRLTEAYWGYLWNQDVQLEKGAKLYTHPAPAVPENK